MWNINVLRHWVAKIQGIENQSLWLKLSFPLMFAYYIGEERVAKLETVRLMGYFFIYTFCNFVFKTGFLIFLKFFYLCKLLYDSLKLSKMYEMPWISISIRKYRDGVFWGQEDVSKNMVNLFLKCKINILEADYFILHFQRVIIYT